MTVNTEVKGTLARLLATENLIIEHRKITTAYFDVERRLLALPIWKDATGDVYDLLVGHEVGHALYTPMEDFGTAPKDYVNVLEDARVERKMKVTYPGLRKSFYAGYRELNTRDFFGISDRDVSKMNLIDRINLHFKLGIIDTCTIPFTEEELVWVDRVANTSTFADVVQLAEELYGYAKQKAEEEIPNQLPPTQSGGGSTPEMGDTEYEPSHGELESDGTSTSSTFDNDSNQNNSADGQQQVDSNSGGPIDDVEVSETNRAWDQKQSDLVDDDAKEWIYLDLPKIKLDRVILPWQVIHKDLTEYFLPSELRFDFTFGKYEDYKKSAQKSVNYLVKQFEMKKSADAYARASVSKTGVINTNSLHKYKLTDDIFKKVTSIPDGKNHGLIFQLDWSGSMQNVMMDTIRQLYNLIWFCRKVQIPFQVYAFQDGDTWAEDPKVETKPNTLHVSSEFRLLQLFSSKMNNKQLDQQMRNVWAQCWGMCGSSYGHGYVGTYGLGSTPLAEAVICTRQIVSEFRKVERVQKVNVICLTDGEANPMKYVVGERSSARYGDHWITDHLCHNNFKIFILRDPVTGYQRKLSTSPYATTQEIVSFFREVTDYNWIGFRIANKTDTNRMVRSSLGDRDSDKVMSTWAKERYVALENGCGFDVQYFLPDKYIGSGTEDLEVKCKGEVATKSELQRAFKKHMGSKMTNKTMLNKFVEVIA